MDEVIFNVNYLFHKVELEIVSSTDDDSTYVLSNYKEHCFIFFLFF